MKKNNDKNNTISVLRIDMNRIPHELAMELHNYAPTKFISHSWIPQPIENRLLISYAFETAKERLEFEEQLPEKFQKMLDRELIDFFYHYLDTIGMIHNKPNLNLQIDPNISEIDRLNFNELQNTDLSLPYDINKIQLSALAPKEVKDKFFSNLEQAKKGWNIKSSYQKNSKKCWIKSLLKFFMTMITHEV